jgi:uncharacterized membrane protein SpoIIM required for sporulation
LALISAVTEAAFVARRQREWDELDALSRRATHRGLRSLAPSEVARVPVLYRDVCADLSRAQAARYSGPLVDYLQGLTAAAHTVVYGAHTKGRVFGGLQRATLRAAFEAFPRAVRRHKRTVLISFLLFFVPFFIGLFASLADPHFAFQIVPESMLRPLTEAYRKGFGEGRGAGEDAAMAGFYVDNNVGIALRCFACGIFFGVGSALMLIFNGLFTGAVMGYITTQGAGGNILTFIVGHGSLELGAIVLAGAAGLALGWSIVSPGDKTRLAALQAVARDVISIVFGAAVMLFMAAGVEGFWSASSAPTIVKRCVGAGMFLIVVGYLTFVGRGREPDGAGEKEGAR